MSTIRKQLFDRLDRARISRYQRKLFIQEMALTRAQSHVARASAGGLDYI